MYTDSIMKYLGCSQCRQQTTNFISLIVPILKQGLKRKLMCSTQRITSAGPRYHKGAGPQVQSNTAHTDCGSCLTEFRKANI